MVDAWKPPLTDAGTLPSGYFVGGARIAYQHPSQLRKRPDVRKRAQTPGYMNDARIAEQRNPGKPTRGSQYGHPNDEAHAWVWI